MIAGGTVTTLNCSYGMDKFCMLNLKLDKKGKCIIMCVGELNE